MIILLNLILLRIIFRNSAIKIIARITKGINDFPSIYKKAFSISEGKEVKEHNKSINAKKR